MLVKSSSKSIISKVYRCFLTEFHARNTPVANLWDLGPRVTGGSLRDILCGPKQLFSCAFTSSKLPTPDGVSRLTGISVAHPGNKNPTAYELIKQLQQDLSPSQYEILPPSNYCHGAYIGVALNPFQRLQARVVVPVKESIQVVPLVSIRYSREAKRNVYDLVEILQSRHLFEWGRCSLVLYMWVCEKTFK